MSDVQIAANPGNPAPELSAQRLQPIERRRAADLPYERFMADYVVRNRPVIIENAVPRWPALERWTPDFFKHKFGSRTVNVTIGVSSRMGDVIDQILGSTREKPGPYLHKVIIHRDMPELLPDLAPENVYGFPRRYASPLMPPRFHRPDGYLKLLIGGVGGKFPIMHFDTDNADALITGIYGQKEFVLFNKVDTPNIYPCGKGAHTSQIENIDDPDWGRFPLLRQATQFRGIIGPGEAAFVPAGWWHTARVVTTSISVCTNMMHQANWSGFVAEACDPQNGGLASRGVKRLYLNAAGAAMSTAEWSQRRFPGSALARQLQVLSPAPQREHAIG